MNSRYSSTDEELEIDDLGKTRINGFAMLIGLVIPLIVFLFLLVRGVFDFLIRKITRILWSGSMNDTSASRSAVAE